MEGVRNQHTHSSSQISALARNNKLYDFVSGFSESNFGYSEEEFILEGHSSVELQSHGNGCDQAIVCTYETMVKY